MPPKKKNANKGESSRTRGLEDTKTEWDNLDLPSLRDEVAKLEQQYQKSTKERNFAQIEHDAIQSYYDVTRKHIHDAEVKIKAKAKEIEEQEEENAVELRVYTHKVKHLDYEHKLKLQECDNQRLASICELQKEYEHQLSKLEEMKTSARNELRERKIANGKEIDQLNQQYNCELTSVIRSLDKDLEIFRKKCSDRQKELEEELDIKRRVEIRCVEEQKNLHIFELEKRHREALAETKKYYEEIMKESDSSILKLTDEREKINQTALQHETLIKSLKEENERLRKPLAECLGKVAKMKEQVKNMEKNKLSLCNTRSRLLVAQDKLKSQIEDYKALQIKYDEVKDEYDQLQGKTESVDKEVSERNKSKTKQLEEKVRSLAQNVAEAESQLEEVVKSAGMNPGEVENISCTLGNLLAEKNLKIEQLQLSIIRAEKSFNECKEELEDNV